MFNFFDEWLHPTWSNYFIPNIVWFILMIWSRENLGAPSQKNLGYLVQVIVLPKQYIGVVRFSGLLYWPHLINFSKVVLKDVPENKDINSWWLPCFSIFVLDSAINVPFFSVVNTSCTNDNFFVHWKRDMFFMNNTKSGAFTQILIRRRKFHIW